MSNSFEKILDLSFFIPELGKWIGIQEIGRLKCTSKKIQSKLTIQNIRPLLEENLTFRSMIFRNQLDIIEQIIPFKFNKRKHKFPKKVLKTLFNKAASEGKLNLINLLLSDESSSVFGSIEVVPFAKIAAERGHIEIAKMIFTKLDWLNEIGIILYGTVQIEKLKVSLLNELSTIAFSRNDREFTKWLLKHSNSNEKLELLEEIETLSAELKINNINQTENENKEKQNWLEYLYFVTTLFLNLTDPYTRTKLLTSDHWDKDTETLGLLKYIGLFIMFLPKQLIQNYVEYWTPKLEEADDLSSFFWLPWYIFIDDFEKFKETATTLKMSGRKSWPLHSRLPDSPFYLVVVRTIERNLPIKYFDFCLDSCDPKADAISFTHEIEKSFRIAIQSKRFDLLHKLFKLISSLHFDSGEAKFALIVDMALETNDVEVLKWIVQKGIESRWIKYYFENALLRNCDTLKVLLDCGFKILEFDHRAIVPFFSDLDFCSLMFRNVAFRDSFVNWGLFLKICLEQGDEDLLRFLFSLNNNFLGFQEIFDSMESIVPNLDVMTEVFNFEMKRNVQLKK